MQSAKFKILHFYFCIFTFALNSPCLCGGKGTFPMKEPLEDLTILDLSRILAGPYCSMLFSDFGARVIKVEDTRKGDDTRAFGPPFKDGESAYFLSVNRGKESVAIDLKSEDGKDVVRRLIKKADVLLENFRPGALDRLGFSYEAAAKINPGLVYVSISGYGGTGPLKDKPGYDLAIQGFSGLMSLTGDPSGQPFKFGTSIADILSGIYAFAGTLLALRVKEKTGKGQRVDVSMLDCMISILTYQAGAYFVTGSPPNRAGNTHPTICPYETFPTATAHVNIAVGNDRLFEKFAGLLGKPEWVKDPRFCTNPERVKNRAALFPLIAEITRTRPRDAWLELFDKEGIPGGPVYGVDEVMNHPQVLARDMVKEVEHPRAGKVKVTGVPVRLTGTAGTVKAAPPLHGAHSIKVLSDLGYSEEEIQALVKKQVLKAP
jgi:crotonobetainyl-CoA:carnitine CoA-transferase CaiB-like acyl-CoA transferase